MAGMESSIDVGPSISEEREHEGPQTRSNSIDAERRALDKSRDVDQRTAWDKLQVSIGYLIYKVNPINIGTVRKELLQQNLIRGKHLFCQFIIQAHQSSPDTHVYATLVATINPALPEIGELVLKRCIKQFKSDFLDEEEADCLALAAFIGHLINHGVADENLAAELLKFVYEVDGASPFEIIILIWEICGKKISQLDHNIVDESLSYIRSLFCLKGLEEELHNRLEIILESHKSGRFKFKRLDLVLADENQITHFLTLANVLDTASNTIDYHYDPEFESNEKMYKSLILKLQLYDSDEENEFESVTDFIDTQCDSEKKLIYIMNKVSDIEIPTNMLSLRKLCLRKMINLIDLTMDCKKLIQQFLIHGQGMDLCFMMLDCCCEHSTYNDNFGLLAQKFCETNNIFADMMEITFIYSCVTSYRFDAHKSQNIAHFFAHLMRIDVLPEKLKPILDDELITLNRRYATIFNTALEHRVNTFLERYRH